MVDSPLLQVLQQRSAHPFAPAIATDDHACHPRTCVMPLIQVVGVETDRSHDLTCRVVCDNRHRQVF
jgi:hypothetical protein